MCSALYVASGSQTKCSKEGVTDVNMCLLQFSKPKAVCYNSKKTKWNRDSHTEAQAIWLPVNHTVLGTAQIADLAGRANLGEQHIAGMQVLVHQRVLMHLGQSCCYLLQQNHHFPGPKPAVPNMRFVDLRKSLLRRIA